MLNWWVLFLWSDYPEWSFDIYLLLISWGIALYMLAVVLYPPDMSQEDSYEVVFKQNRKRLYRIFIVFRTLDISQTAVRGQLFDPVIYLPFVLQYAVLSGIGIATASRRYQVFFAWYLLITLSTWSLIVRRLLGG